MRNRPVVLTAVVLILAVGLEAGAGLGYGDYLWARIPGFFALFGLAGCWLLIVLAKGVGKAWLQRSEDYYQAWEGEDARD